LCIAWLHRAAKAFGTVVHLKYSKLYTFIHFAQLRTFLEFALVSVLIIPIFCRGQVPFLPPNQQHQSTEGN